jgi:hypothetical protein
MTTSSWHFRQLSSSRTSLTLPWICRLFIFFWTKELFFVISKLNVCGKIMSISRLNDSQEMDTEECKEGLFRWRRVSIPGVNIVFWQHRVGSWVYNHCSFKHTQDRHVHRCAWNCCPRYSEWQGGGILKSLIFLLLRDNFTSKFSKMI